MDINNKILALLKAELVVALGCTEPVAVALAVATAAEHLTAKIEKIEVKLSRNILKNAMGVGIPASNDYGLPIAIALGATIAKAEKGLEIFSEVNDVILKDANAIIDEKIIDIQLAKTEEKLWIEVDLFAKDQHVHVIVQGQHTHFILIEKNNEVIKKGECLSEKSASNIQMSLRDIYNFATQMPIESLKFVKESVDLNLQAAEAALQEDWGLNVGRAIIKNVERKILTPSVTINAMAYTAAASDARMAGAAYPVMSNSGSGNQGISATLPVWAFAKHLNNTEEELIRALTLSHLVVIYIKQKLGRLSALCGCVIAGSGASCGIVLLLNGSYQQVCAAIKNMSANIVGMVCDGAKPGCALKVATGANVAIQSALLAIDNVEVSKNDGIIDQDIEKTIDNIANIGSQSMLEVDKLILEIMVNKA